MVKCFGMAEPCGRIVSAYQTFCICWPWGIQCLYNGSEWKQLVRALCENECSTIPLQNARLAFVMPSTHLRHTFIILRHTFVICSSHIGLASHKESDLCITKPNIFVRNFFKDKLYHDFHAKCSSNIRHAFVVPSMYLHHTFVTPSPYLRNNLPLPYLRHNFVILSSYLRRTFVIPSPYLRHIFAIPSLYLRRTFTIPSPYTIYMAYISFVVLSMHGLRIPDVIIPFPNTLQERRQDERFHCG